MDNPRYYSDMLKLNIFLNNTPHIYNRGGEIINNNYTDVIGENLIKREIEKNEGKNIYTDISSQEMQDLIYTRIIVSSIGCFLCIICVILYIIIFIKKRCMRSKSNLDYKANKFEKLNTIDNKLGEKFLTDKSKESNGGSNCGDESDENKIRISDLSNTKNYFRNSGSHYYDNRLSKQSHLNNDNNILNEDNNANLKNPFLSKNGISKVPTVCTLDFQRKTANTIAVEHNRNLLSNLDDKDKDQTYYRISEPFFKGKDDEEINHQRISIIKEINVSICDNNQDYKIDETSNNFLITFDENCTRFNGSKDEVINKYNGSSNYLMTNKLKFYENEDFVDSKKDILENVYEKNILHNQDLNHRNSKYRTFSNGNKNGYNKRKSLEDLSENKPSSSINNREENSNFLNYSNANSSNNLFNNSSIENKAEKNNQSKKIIGIKKVSSNQNLSSNGSKMVLIKVNYKRNSDFNSFYDHKENVITTNSNHNSKNNYNYTSSNLMSYKKNDTILAQSDSEEYKNHIHNPSYDEVSYASKNSIANHSVARNAKPKELKMGMINDILVMLIFSNLGFLSSSFLISNTKNLIKDDPMCEMQGLFQNYFDLASICWTTVVSNIMKNMIISININSEKRKFKWYLSYCLIMPLIFCLGPMITDSYGPSGPWCWIQSPCGNHTSKLSKEDIWIYIMYTFMWSHILIICSHFYKIIKYFTKRLREIRHQNREDEKKFIKKNKLILYCFPIILILSKTPATINRAMFIFFSFENVILFHLQAAFSPMIGILNSFVFIHIHIRFLREKKIKICGNFKEVMGRSSDL